MQRPGWRVLLTTILILTAFLLLTRPVPAAPGNEPPDPHFPKPAPLQANVEFWRQIYAEYGVGDFVLHDRENLRVIYDVVRIEGATNESRAAAAARPEIQRLRDKYADILESLAQGMPPEEVGSEGPRVAQVWGCPCPPELLRRAATNIRVQQGLRQKVQDGMKRARSLLPRILPILRQHNVPEELAALPMVESTFNPAAKSKAGAVGLWQFIKPTGKRYLTIKGRRDDRRDPIRATEAAARLLKHNYEALGSWPLAITAYNHGQEGMLAARAAVGSSAIEEIIGRYTGPRFGFASRNFYAEFLAALEVLRPHLTPHARPETAKTARDTGPKGSIPAIRPPVPMTTSPAPPDRPDPPSPPETNEVSAPAPSCSPPPAAEPQPQTKEAATDAALAPGALQASPAAEPGVKTQDAGQQEAGIP